MLFRSEFHPAVAPADRSSAAVLYAFPHQETYSERYSVPAQSMNDRVVCALSHRVFSLGLRPGGKSAKLLELRLADPEIDPSSLWLATDSTLPRNVLDLQRRFNARGAVLWFPVLPKAIEIPPLGCRLRSIPPTLQITGKLPRGLIESTDYFIHCTRSREGKWPDQDDRAFLAESFRLAFEYNPSPLNTLLRIVRTQRLIGTSARKRGGLPSISFTANPLGEILSRREFQHHLAHWDWEPFGIAISKERLIHMGARQVQYVTKSTMNALSIDEQRFCQPAKEAENGRDWSSEEEWRLPGDLRLSKLTPSDAFLFVGDRTSAKLLAHYSRWPVFWL